MNLCGLKPLGKVRFLADGSFAVLPGVQPGVYLYNAQGDLARTWDTGSLGIDSDCLSLSQQQADYMAMRPRDRHVWVNQRQTVDTLLPLEQGLGLVVRRVASGRTRWDLKLLLRDGSVETYGIPIEGSSEYFHLRGDVRSGRIVLLLKDNTFRGRDKEQRAASRLFVAQLPGAVADQP